MELPKITKDQLTNELREVVGDVDLEFESVINDDDLFDIQIDPDAFYERRAQIGKMLVEQRKNNEIQGHY
tara:strand:- start:13531 stop:13740 length:210 start_codon:yes stop_codon:yes gene_type:complete